DGRPGDVAAAPEAEVEISADLVARLLAHQLADSPSPGLAGLVGQPLRPAGSGWDNVLYRLGDAHAVRLPRRRVAVELLLNERRFLPRLAPGLPLPVPEPVFAGRPGRGYPWPWSVTGWLPGDPADLSSPAPEASTALAEFLLALHRPAADDAPWNSHRSVALRDKAPALADRFRRLRAGAELPPALDDVWRAAVEADIDRGPTWIHGDLHPQNVLVAGGRIAGVIDWGDLCAGDPATDLAAIWLLFDRTRDRAAALERYGASEQTVRRARGWALFFGVVFTDIGRVDKPRELRLGRRALSNVLAGP
ncbi:MAG: aminoglycoside phosphotransferase family protein, partial [Acidobacteriota bacterium]